MVTVFSAGYFDIPHNFAEILAWFFLAPAVSAYLAMNFTGASTYTSLSGVKKEMKWAVPIEIAAGVVGLTLLVGSRFVS
jgi:acetyl-CoA decarbonylase/synthase complex subunit gamma